MQLVKDAPTAIAAEPANKTLRITLLVAVEIPLAPDANRQELEQDVLSTVRKVAATQLHYVTDAGIAHSMEFEPGPQARRHENRN